MQTSTYAVKGNAAFAFQRRSSFSNLHHNRSATTTTTTGIRFFSTGSCFTPLHCSRSKAMGAKLARGENGIHSLSSSVKARSVRAQSSSSGGGGGDEEEAIPLRSQQGNSSGTVLPFVGVTCLGAILFGYHLGVVNGALEYLAKDLGIADNAVLQGWIVSALLAGATVGSFTGGALADKFGRTRTFQLDAIPLAIGAFLCATAQSVQTMIVGRLLAGIGIGISSAIVPLYISEISPTEIRGALGSVNQLFICIGILAALIAGLPLAANPLWWRTMFGVAVIPSLLLAIGMAFSPESPRWLVQQGKLTQAEKAIKTLYGKEKVVELVRDLSTSGQGTSEPEAGWFDLFSSRYWKVVSVGAALFLFQQLAGINAVVYYSTSVFRSAGIQSDVAASALVGASNVFGTAVASSLMDKMGRKSLLLTSFGGMALSMMLLSLSFTWKALAAYSGTLAVVGTVLYVLSFSLGAGPVPALLLPEIFASRIRAKAVALSLGMHWISNFVIGLYFLSVVTKFGISSVYLGFAGVCVLAVMYIAGNVVETKGRSLEEIELALTSGQLIGICIEGRTRCLIYELVHNGSVESHLHEGTLDWDARLKIALGAARGLAYLHEDSNPRVIHRDFKASNVLLEDDFTPKVSDFGLAREATEGSEHISTRVMGTFGYVAPEYAMTGHLLVKSDVYSYGVVLLELLTGRRPVDMSQPSGEENLVTWARPLLANREGLEQMVDPTLARTYDFDDMAKVAAIASMCVHQEVSHRPFMGEVVQALKLIYNDADETCGGDYCSQKESSVPDSADFKGDLAPSDSSWWNLTPRLRYGQASTFITMDYSSGPLEEMENRPHSASSIPREGGLFLENRSGPLRPVRSRRNLFRMGGSMSEHGGPSSSRHLWSGNGDWC